jgi:hypothetical protein
MGDKSDCPVCLNSVNPGDSMNCVECMTCKQHMHAQCIINWSHARKPTGRLLKDDIYICPVCRGDSIAYCKWPNIDMNEDKKAAVAVNPYKRGGKRVKRSKQVKRSKRVKRSKQTKKNRK